MPKGVYDHSMFKKEKVGIECPMCGEVFFMIPSLSFKKHCSKKCFAKSKIGGKSNWRGGRHSDSNGYILIYMPAHPFAFGKKVFEHRLIMEKHLKRYLSRKEVVHHINGNHADNRLENLQLFPNNGEHLRLHFKEKKC